MKILDARKVGVSHGAIRLAAVLPLSLRFWLESISGEIGELVSTAGGPIVVPQPQFPMAASQLNRSVFCLFPGLRGEVILLLDFFRRIGDGQGARGCLGRR